MEMVLILLTQTLLGAWKFELYYFGSRIKKYEHMKEYLRNDQRNKAFGWKKIRQLVQVKLQNG